MILRRLSFLFLLLTTGMHSVMGQSLDVPRNIVQAFKNGTRSWDGRPGKNYWQNRANYNITVTALPPDRIIEGQEKIIYFNQSPDTLKNLVFSLILNIHQAGAIRDEAVNPNSFTPGIQFDSLEVNGENAQLKNNPFHATWKELGLSTPLLPGDSIRLFIQWHDQISSRSGREGMIDSTTYYLAYFYPRVAVFDDYNGWDRLDFTGEQEFYNDFNDYDFTVRVPQNFLVWATGTLLNGSQVLQNPYLDRLRESRHSDSTVHIVREKDLAKKNITPNQGIISWHWEANDVTDIAIALSNHDVWDGSSVVVNRNTGRRALVQAAYNDTAMDFHHAVQFGRYTLNFLSSQWPGVSYPYPKMTVVQGNADMEYPMMVNDATTQNLIFSRLVEDHEISHTYFPFYMGTNESRYAFMDEGWATTFELLIGRTENSISMADQFYKAFRINRWIHDPSQEEELPIITPSNELIGVAYGNNSYGKPSLSYLAIKDLLGDSLFKKCLQAYISRWHGKHPIPWDYFNTFNDVSGKNLNWFWNNWFFSNNYIDLALQKVTKTTQGYQFLIKNIGGFAIPFNIQIDLTDGSSYWLHETPEIWSKDQKKVSIFFRVKKKIKSVLIKSGIFMDADRSDNEWKAK
ncbi:MAG: M1 family metallopeptidase [Chitinophagaceae bacterium]